MRCSPSRGTRGSRWARWTPRNPPAPRTEHGHHREAPVLDLRLLQAEGLLRLRREAERVEGAARVQAQLGVQLLASVDLDRAHQERLDVAELRDGEGQLEP